MVKYEDFLARKVVTHTQSGFDVDDAKLNPMLFDYQRDIVRFTLKNGRAAVFLDCGLGKTVIQLEWARLVAEHTDGQVLIVAPLCVVEQTAREASKFHEDGVAVVRSDADCTAPICIVNYEMVQAIDVTRFVGVVLDESSILKSLAGKTKLYLCDAFAQTPFRLALTATPSPNDQMELLNQAEFLGIMGMTEALTRWFVHDSSDTKVWRLKRHAERDFWGWVCTWAVYADTPADLGYALDVRHKLPTMEVHTDFIDTAEEVHEDGALFDTEGISATGIYRHLRETIGPRAIECARIVNADTDQYIIWVNTNFEEDAILPLVSGAVAVRGSDKPEVKKKAALDFIDGKIRVLVSKPSIFGFGMNLQNCRNAVFLGLNFSYESYYQAYKRIYRFGQTRPVNVHIILSKSEYDIYKTVKQKEAMNDSAKASILAYTRDMQMVHTTGRKLKMDYERREVRTDDYCLINGDSVEEIKAIETGSVDFSIFSPPFSNLYVYSDSYRDMGNCENDAEFFQHYDFLAGELFRITRAGRLVAVHSSNIPNFKWRDGHTSMRDFRGELVKAMERAGFRFHSEVTIWKDPVVEMQRTKAQGLLHKQVTRTDATLSRQGMPDYLSVFRKWPESEADDVRKVLHEGGFKYYIGAETPTNSIEVWQRYASPVWFDIRQGRVLSREGARADRDEKHICPLQLDVIERAIHLWTNDGDVVFSPFAGIGSEGYGAVRLGRKFVGIELKREYFDQAVKNIGEAYQDLQQPTLF